MTKNNAKLRGQFRTSVASLCGVLAALNVASQEQAATLMGAANAVIESGFALAGIGGIIVMQAWSWFDPAKKVGEGD